MRKLICLLLIICCTGLSTGCWDADEITSLSVINAIGVDAASQPGKINLFVQVSPPGGASAGGGSPSTSALRVLSVEAESIIEGVTALQSRLRRRPFLSNLGFVVVGENLARSGLSAVIAQLLGENEIRGSVPLFVTYGSAEAILRAHSGTGRSPAEDVMNLLQNTNHSPTGQKVTVNQAINILEGTGSELALPILDLAPLDLSSGAQLPPDGTGQGGERYTEVVMARTALFSRDRWIDTLDRLETNILLRLFGKSMQSVITMPNPADETQTMAVQIESYSISYDLTVNGAEPPQVVLHPKAIIRLLDVQGSYNIAPRGLKPIELATEFDLGQAASQLIAKLQQLNVDSLGIGQKIAGRYPKAWSQLKPIWSEAYPKVQFDVQPHAIIRSTGLIKKFFQMKP